MNTHFRKRQYFIILLFVLLAYSLAATPLGVRLGTILQLPSTGKISSLFLRRRASQLPVEVPTSWYELAYELVRDEQLSPPVAARIFGYLGVALYEALVPDMPDYQSLVGQLNGLENLPQPSDISYHLPTVANSTLAATLRAFLPKASGSSQASISALENRFIKQFRPAVTSEVYRRSVEWGQSISQAIQRWADSDGIGNNTDCAYTPPTGSGMWSPTPPGNKPPLLPCWGKMRPFALGDGNDCNSGPPLDYSETPDSGFYKDAWEVYTTVNYLTPEQLNIAQFWADNPGQTGTPPGHSISILNQILFQKRSSLETAAEAYARLGIALADSFIACWWTKYEYNLVRPITYIHAVLGDTDWSSPVNTPPFPEYSSGHSVQSAAAAQVLTDMFGAQPFTDNTHEALGYAPRKFPDFFAFAEEAAISRLYGGIHYRTAIERGLVQGKCIGSVVSDIQFRKP